MHMHSLAHTLCVINLADLASTLGCGSHTPLTKETSYEKYKLLVASLVAFSYTLLETYMCVLLFSCPCTLCGPSG